MGVGFMCADHKRQTVGLEEIVNSDVPKADTVSSAQRRSKALGIAARLLLFSRGVTPYAVRGDLLLPLRLVGIGWGDAGNRRHGKNRLNSGIECVNGAREAAVNAIDVVINDSRERQPIEHSIALLPNLFTDCAAEPRLGLK